MVPPLGERAVVTSSVSPRVSCPCASADPGRPAHAHSPPKGPCSSGRDLSFLTPQAATESKVCPSAWW